MFAPFFQRSFLLALVVAWLGAMLCTWLNTPLPWMIGPLFTTAALRTRGLSLSCPVQVREAGQWAIGTALGLYFTASVLVVLGAWLGYIAAGVVFALMLGMVCGWVLHKLSGADAATTFFAMAVGGASEMAVQGEHHGARVDLVAAAHSLRIMMVVAAIPFAFKFAGVHGADPFVPAAQAVDYTGLPGLVAATVALALVLKRRGWPNVWVIGPLLASTALTAGGVTLSALPDWIVHWGQLFIGISLGTRFSPAFLRTAPRYLASVAACTLLAIGLSVGFALLLATASGMHPATAILATSPGGIAEMSLTAHALQLGVPVVTAFHSVRMAAVVLCAGPLFRSLCVWRKKRSGA